METQWRMQCSPCTPNVLHERQVDHNSDSWRRGRHQKTSCSESHSHSFKSPHHSGEAHRTACLHTWFETKRTPRQSRFPRNLLYFFVGCKWHPRFLCSPHSPSLERTLALFNYERYTKSGRKHSSYERELRRWLPIWENLAVRLCPQWAWKKKNFSKCKSCYWHCSSITTEEAF